MGKFIYSRILLPIWEGIKNYYISIIVSCISGIFFSVWRMLVSGLNWYSFFESLSLIFAVLFLILSIIFVIQKSQNENKKEIYNIKEEIINIYKEQLIIDGKLIIFPDFLYRVITDQNKCKLSIILQIYNCSNQIINCIIDEEKTKLIVNEKTKHKFQYTNTNQLLVPYHLFGVSTDFIEFDLTTENILNKSIQINAEIHLKYGFKENENYIVSIKIENFVKLVRIGDNNIIAIQLPLNSSIKLPA